MEDVTEKEEAIDKVTKMAAELIFSVDAHISLINKKKGKWRTVWVQISTFTVSNDEAQGRYLIES